MTIIIKLLGIITTKGKTSYELVLAMYILKQFKQYVFLSGYCVSLCYRLYHGMSSDLPWNIRPVPKGVLNLA